MARSPRTVTTGPGSQLVLGDDGTPSTVLPPSITEGVRWLALPPFSQVKKLRLVTQEMITEPKVWLTPESGVPAPPSVCGNESQNGDVEGQSFKGAYFPNV